MLGFIMWCSLTAGLQYNQTAIGNSFLEQSPIFVGLDVHLENEYLDLYGKYQNNMDKGDIYFIPTQDYFTVGATAKLGALTITAEHMCKHPVGSFRKELIGEYGGYNKIWVNICSTSLK